MASLIGERPKSLRDEDAVPSSPGADCLQLQTLTPRIRIDRVLPH